MPKKKEPKYKLGLYDKDASELFTICDEHDEPVLVTKQEMQYVMGIYDKLKGINGER